MNVYVFAERVRNKCKEMIKLRISSLDLLKYLSDTLTTGREAEDKLQK